MNYKNFETRYIALLLLAYYVGISCMLLNVNKHLRFSYAGSVARAQTLAEYNYNSVWMSTGGATDFVFEVKSEKDAHILLSTQLNLNTSTGQTAEYIDLHA